jgi:hypothetical protein
MEYEEVKVEKILGLLDAGPRRILFSLASAEIDSTP